MHDILLEKFFETDRWSTAIAVANNKDIDMSLLKKLTDPRERVNIYRQIKNNEYVIAPPHEARIPKDDGTFRTVYINENTDRIFLSIANDLFFELCPELIHERCKSYQKHIGCGKIVQNVSQVIQSINTDEIGIKIDLSKYFDSVPIEYIDDIFNHIETKLGKSKILDIVKIYYHTNTVIDFDKNVIEKYSSLRQGCAVAAFLADSVLHDIDDFISNNYDVYYVRYSDDILILGNEWQTAYEQLSKMLNAKSLTLNPKKVEKLHKQTWFKFLGFTIKNDRISLSKSRIKTFQSEIEKRTICAPNNNISTITKRINHYLYKGNGEFSWATSVLPIINVEQDINTLNSFVMDAIRAAVTGKTKIGGLGFDEHATNKTILRGKGNNVKTNKEKIPILNNYTTIKCMQNAMLTNRQAYETLVRNM